jgi:glycosyltransferase involved in cell wall biosynthesis
MAELTTGPSDIATSQSPGRSTYTLSVVTPTRNEQENIASFVSRVRLALIDIPAELIVVDDSDDQTPEIVAELSESSAVPVRMTHRVPGERTGGLAGAVLTGLRLARAPWAVVMDADFQHPPGAVRELLSAANKGHADVVVCSRYTAGTQQSSTDGLDTRRRRFVSRACNVLARMVFPRRLRHVTDPMSGFFAVRLDALDRSKPRPYGFKILFELLIRCGPLRVREIPYRFDARAGGQSKASMREGFRFLVQLLSLRLWLLCRQPHDQLTRAVAFALVGGSGIAVNSLALWAFSDPKTLYWNYLLGSILATQFSSTWNFFWTERYVFAGPKRSTMPRRFIQFLLLNNATLLLRVPLLALAVEVVGLHYLLGNIIVIGLVFVLRYLICDRLIFKPHPAVSSAPQLPSSGAVDGRPVMPRGAPVQRLLELVPNGNPQTTMANVWRSHLPYRYDIFGLVHVGSQVELTELDYFRAQSLGRDFDIELRVGHIGKGPHRRIILSRAPGGGIVSYEEHLGRLGANFRLEVTDRLRLTISPLLARSPHVAYTNVMEALLRYVLVERGRVLLHSACVEMDGRGVMLSAKTDTGKTGTILRLLRDHGARFLSDDMTILDPNAHAYCFPKPLTISHHTLRAVEPGELTAGEWRWLRLQSRLHSKEGRSWGMWLGNQNLPIMSMNSLTQMMIPPPKHVVDRLVSCDVISDTQVDSLFIIERGEPVVADIERGAALDELIVNTDDAYGFPPFRYFAPILVLGGDDYETLRRKERELLADVVSRIRVRRLASDNFGWPNEIPRLLRESAPTSGYFDGTNGHPHNGVTNGKVIDLAAAEAGLRAGTTPASDPRR